MSLVVYGEDMKKTYWLRSVTSLQETAFYNDTGKITINAPADDLNIAALRVGNLVYDTDRDWLYVLMNTKVDTANLAITANGMTAEAILNRRASRQDITITNIESGVYEVINANIETMKEIIQTAPVKGYTEEFTVETTDMEKSEKVEVKEASALGGQLLDAVDKFLEHGDLGRRATWNPNTRMITFEVYKGVDRTEGIHKVVFSTEQGTARDLVINDDDSTWYNCAAASWEWDGKPWMTLVGHTFTPADRELWVNTGVSGEGEAKVFGEKKKEAAAKAAEELEKYIQRTSFTATIPGDDFGGKYSLGDTVKCSSVRYGVSFDAKIKSVKYTLDTKQEKTEVILGDPILNIMEEVRLRVY